MTSKERSIVKGRISRVRTKVESRDGSLTPCRCQAGFDGFSLIDGPELQIRDNDTSCQIREARPVEYDGTDGCMHAIKRIVAPVTKQR